MFKFLNVACFVLIIILISAKLLGGKNLDFFICLFSIALFLSLVLRTNEKNNYIGLKEDVLGILTEVP